MDAVTLLMTVDGPVRVPMDSAEKAKVDSLLAGCPADLVPLPEKAP